MGTISYKGIKYSQGKFIEVNDALAIEGPLKILLNNQPFTVTMRSPGSDEALVRGLLYTEDVYKEKKIKPIIEILESDNLGFPVAVNVSLESEKIRDGYLNKRSLLSVSSCGICGKTELNDLSSENALSSKIKIDPEGINEMFNKMKEHQYTFRLSGGSHAAAAFDLNGEMLSMQEDIGRHNAVDKVIGDLLNNEIISSAKCLLVSGRISYEIVSKCFIAGIPVLAAVSAPSSLAVDFSKELGITLMAFCRDGKLTVYSHPEQVNIIEKNNSHFNVS